MANDLIQVKCKFCGETQVLCKVWGHEEAQEIDAARLAAFAEFFGKHSRCHPLQGVETRAGEPGFVFLTESDAAEESPGDHLAKALEKVA